MMSPDLSPFGPALDALEERRRSQALMGVADVEANLSEEKLLQVDMTDGGKVTLREDPNRCLILSDSFLVTASLPVSSPSTLSSLAPSPRGLGEAVRSPPSSTSV